MDIKFSITGNDRITILNSCEVGEDHAIETYEKVLRDDLEYLSEEQRSMISSQQALIHTDHFTLKSIRDTIASANKSQLPEAWQIGFLVQLLSGLTNPNRVSFHYSRWQ